MTEVLEIRGRDATERWLLASLGLARLDALGADAVARAVPWIVGALDELPTLPPLGVIADLGVLLLGGRSSLVPLLVASSARRLAAAMRAYDDEWIARLANERCVDAAIDAVAALPPELRSHAVGVLAARVLARIGFDAGTTASVAAARRLFARDAAEIATRAEVALHHPEAQAALASGYDGLVRAARAAPRLIDDADVFLLENLTVLGASAQRVAVAHAVEAAEALGRALPGGMRPRPRAGASTPTHVEDESAYPAGGFASITTTGSMENLVTSEVVFMEDGPDIDLFDVRYAEGELLYYARDEALHLRRRRAILFVLEPGLAALRFKDPGLAWQGIVLLIGLVAAAVGKLFTWLAEEDLFVEVVLLRDAIGAAPLAPERGLLEILLRDRIEREVAAVRDAARADLAAEVGVRARKIGTTVVFVGDAGAAASFRERLPHVRYAVLDAASIAPTWPAWCDAATGLLRAIV